MGSNVNESPIYARGKEGVEVQFGEREQIATVTMLKCVGWGRWKVESVQSSGAYRPADVMYNLWGRCTEV